MTTHYTLAIEISEYRDEYRFKTYKRLTNLKKALKEYKFRNPYMEFISIRGNPCTNWYDHDYEYTIKIGCIIY